MQEISEEILKKADSQLRGFLYQNRKDQILKVILHLNDDITSHNAQYKKDISPQDYKSRKEYREALLSQQSKLLDSSLGKTKEEIIKLSIKLKGGKNSNIVTAYGTPGSFRHALSLPGVVYGQLDQSISFDQIDRRKSIEKLSLFIKELLKLQKENTEAEFVKSRIFKGAENFFDSYERTYGNLRILGLSDTKPLNTVYTDIEVCDVTDFNKKISIEKLSYSFLNRKPRSSGNNISAFSLLKENKSIVIFGETGSGKSIFLKKVALNSIRNSEKDDIYKVPVLFELKKISIGALNIVEEIEKEFRRFGIPSPSQFVKAALKLGRIIVLLDGLDEVPASNMRGVKDGVSQFILKYGHNRLIISCRAAAYQEVENIRCLDTFRKVRIVDFNDDKISQFIKSWFSSEKHIKEDTAINCIRLLRKPENANARELARTPLFLTFLCLIYDYYRDFPENRVFLYRQALHILLKEWPAQKKDKSQEIFKKLELHMEEVLLSEIAYESFESNRHFLRKSWLEKRIQDFLESNHNSPKNLLSDIVLRELTTTQGILIEQFVDSGEPIYSFSHLTFQEYLAAKYVHESFAFKELIANYLEDKGWRSIFPLVSGLMLVNPGADEMIHCILDETKRYINLEDKLADLIAWASERCSKFSYQDRSGLVERTFLLKCAFDYLTIKTKNQNIVKNINLSIFWSQHWSYSIDFPNDFKILRAIINVLITANRILIYGASENKSYRSDLSEIRKNLQESLEKAKLLQKQLRQHRTQNTRQAIHNIRHGYTAKKQAITRISVFKESQVHELVSGLELLIDNFPDNQINVSNLAKVKRIYSSLNKLCSELFGLPDELILISLEESMSIEQYFYVNYVLSLCVNAASRISKKAFKEVRDKMLTIW